MSEKPPPPDNQPVTAPADSADQPTAFEPAFRAVQELFQSRLKEARSKTTP